jgi:hypothetical protein
VACALATAPTGSNVGILPVLAVAQIVVAAVLRKRDIYVTTPLPEA